MSGLPGAPSLYEEGLASQSKLLHQEAIEFFQRALADGGSPRDQARIANSLGWSYQQRRRLPEAEQAYRQAVEFAKAAGDIEERSRAEDNLARLRSDAELEPFEFEVRHLEADAKTRPMGGVVFYGSSSIRLWPLANAFAKYPVVNRGFGGARLEDCIHYLPRLVAPLQPRIVILYAGDNDFADGATPPEIAAHVTSLIQLLRRQVPSCQVAFLSVKPSPVKSEIASVIEEANACIRALGPQLDFTFLDIYGKMLGPDNLPNGSLFSEDGLHMTAAGYEIWTRAVNEYLASIWPRARDLARESSRLPRQHHKIESRFVHRAMNVLIFGYEGARVLIFPTYRGDYAQAEQLGTVEVLADRLTTGQLQLVCVDGFDAESLYNKSLPPRERIQLQVQFERHILEEVLPLSESINPGSPLIAQGCSLGAYHAVNIAFRHPKLFTRVIALGGRYDLCRDFGGGFRDLFDGYYDTEIYFNNPSHFMRDMWDPTILADLRGLHVLLAIGEWDSFIDNNREFSAILNGKSIPHRLLTWGGVAHGYRHWNEALRLYL